MIGEVDGGGDVDAAAGFGRLRRTCLHPRNAGLSPAIFNIAQGWGLAARTSNVLRMLDVD
jgi:hypothetical protein